MGLIVATVGVEMVLTGTGEAIRAFIMTMQSMPMPRPDGF